MRQRKRFPAQDGFRTYFGELVEQIGSTSMSLTAAATHSNMLCPSPLQLCTMRSTGAKAENTHPTDRLVPSLAAACALQPVLLLGIVLSPGLPLSSLAAPEGCAQPPEQRTRRPGCARLGPGRAQELPPLALDPGWRPALLGLAWHCAPACSPPACWTCACASAVSVQGHPCKAGPGQGAAVGLRLREYCCVP